MFFDEFQNAVHSLRVLTGLDELLRVVIVAKMYDDFLFKIFIGPWFRSSVSRTYMKLTNL